MPTVVKHFQIDYKRVSGHGSKALGNFKTKKLIWKSMTTEVLTKIGRGGATKRHISVLKIRIYYGG